LTHAIPAEPGYFFEELEYRIRDIDANYDYTKIWRCLEQQAQAQLTDFLQKAPFGEFKAMQQVLAALPADSRLQLGNSMIIRYANFIAHLPNMGQSSVHSNRGASGIDGCVSTALGAALTTDQLTTLLIGDLAFFYDRNGLWQRRIPTNLRIVIFNNHGGGIFDIIEGPNRLPQTTQKDFFLTPHPLTAKRTAEDYQLDYFQAGHEDELGALLPAFFAARPRAAILEITSEMATNSQVFQQFRSLVAALHC
jgi:2-succinyl-5-enolpyruvyl-6-hydroxy-3-cyclohexene-1-carboxylate synthase